MLQLTIKYFSIAFIVSLIIVLFNVFSDTGEIRYFWQGLRILFWLTLGPGAGMLIGALIRQWLIPDTIYTREGSLGIFKAKVFWLMGPQSIGWLLGLFSVAQNLY